MGKVVFIISTRDFPFDSNLFEDVNSNRLDEFVISNDNIKSLLHDCEKKKCAKAAAMQRKDKETLFKQELRTKIWGDSKARYANSNYQETGLKVRKRTSIRENKEYLIYIAPCTSDNDLSKDFKLSYTKKIIEIVNEDLGTLGDEILSRHLIAHDSDISSDAGSGVVPPINDYYSCKFQHIEKDSFYQKIKQIIEEEDIFSNCEELCSMINPLAELFKLNLPEGNDGEDKVVKAYLDIKSKL